MFHPKEHLYGNKESSGESERKDKPIGQLFDDLVDTTTVHIIPHAARNSG